MEVNKHSISELSGKLKVWQTRAASYIALINFVMIFYLYIIESPMNLDWYHWLLIISIIVITIIFIDTRYIFPHAQSYTFQKNPEMLKLKKQIELNTEKLNIIIKHLE